MAVAFALVFYGRLLVAAENPETPEPTPPVRNVELALTNVEIGEAMQMLSDATGFNIIVSPNTKGQITAFVNTMDAEKALQEIVEVNGLHYVKRGDVVWVLSDEEYYEDFNLGRDRRIVSLLHARAADVAAALASTLSKEAVIVPYPDSNVLIIAEKPDRIDALEKLALDLDVPPLTRIYQLSHASAEEMVRLLQPYAANPAAVQADLRTNQIILSGTPEMLERLGVLLNEFDKPDKIATRVFALKHANALETAALIEEVLTGRKQGGLGQFAAPQSGGQQQQAPRVFTTEPGRANPMENWNKYRAVRRPESAAPPTTGARPGTGASAPTTPTAAPTAAASQAPSLEAPTGEPGAVATGDALENVPLGPIATIAADVRTNSVIVTHVESVLLRIEEIIARIDVPGTFSVYQFKNVNPADLELETKLATLFPAEGSFLNVDPLSKKVTFRAAPDKAEEILHLLKQWDDNVPQVSIEAEILSVNVNLIRDLGISWQAVTSEFSEAAGGIINPINAQVTFPPNIGTIAPQGRFSIGNVADADYNVLIQALESDSDTQIVASPRVLVRDGQQAVFSSVRDEPYTVVSVAGDTQTTLEDVKFLNVGVSLIVAPFINKDDLITMDVQLEISSLVEFRNNVPVVDRSTAQSNVSVKDNGTLILGGLRQRQRAKVVRGLPFLSKIPVAGALFRNKRNDDSEREIILVLRPQVTETTQSPVPIVPEVHDDMRRAIKEKRMGDRPPLN